MRVPRLRFRSTAVLVFATAVSFGTAQAQFGALRRAVDRRVEQKVEDKAASATLIAPTFDATTIEITEARLTKYIDEMTKLKAVRAQRRAETQALEVRANALRDSARMFDDAGERRAYEAGSERYSSCRDDVRKGIEDGNERRMAEMAQRMQANPLAAQSDPKMKAMAQTGQLLAAAQQRGDAAEVERLQRRMMSDMGVAPFDSITVDRAAQSKCGGRPAIPASMLQYSRYTARADSVRLLAQGGAGRGYPAGAALGMTDRQSRMMWERIQSWLNGVNDGAPITKTFTKPEYDLLLAKRGDLRRAFSGGE
jgi:hypothetical protein